MINCVDTYNSCYNHNVPNSCCMGSNPCNCVYCTACNPCDACNCCIPCNYCTACNPCDSCNCCNCCTPCNCCAPCNCCTPCNCCMPCNCCPPCNCYNCCPPCNCYNCCPPCNCCNCCAPCYNCCTPCNCNCCCCCCFCPPNQSSSSEKIPKLPIPIPPVASTVNFEGKPLKMKSDDYYSMIPVDIKGDAIKSGKLKDSILLAPKKTYKYSVETETTLEGTKPGSIGAFLELDGEKLPVSTNDITNVEPGNLIKFKTSGELTIEDKEGTLFLGFKTNAEDGGVTSAKLTISEVEK